MLNSEPIAVSKVAIPKPHEVISQYPCPIYAHCCCQQPGTVKGQSQPWQGASSNTQRTVSWHCAAWHFVCHHSLQLQCQFGEVIFSAASVWFQVGPHHHHLITGTAADL